MTFALPAPNNDNDVAITSDPLYVATLDSAVNFNSTAYKGLPIDDGNAASFEIVTTGQYGGFVKNFLSGGAGIDVSSGVTRVMLIAIRFDRPENIQINTIANAGITLRLYSGAGSPSTNWREWRVGGSDSPLANCAKGFYPLALDLNAANYDASNGTFDNTDIRCWGIRCHKLDLVSGSTPNMIMYISKMYLLVASRYSSDIGTFTGTASILDAVDFCAGTTFSNKVGEWVRRIGDAVAMDMGFRIGDNSTATQFTDDGKTIIFSGHNSSTDPRSFMTSNGQALFSYLRDNAADTITLSGVWVFRVNASIYFNQNNDSVITLNDPVFRGLGWSQWGSEVSGSASFFDCSPQALVHADADLNGSTFRGSISNVQLRIAAGGSMDIADMTFLSYSGKHAIRIEAAGTYGIDNCTFDHSGTDIETTHASGVVTINVTNGDSVGLSVTQSGAGTYVLNDYKTVTVTVLEPDLTPAVGVPVRIENASTGALVLSGTTNGSGVVTTDAYNYSSDESVTVIARYSPGAGPRYLPIRQSATITSSGLIATYTLIDDTIAT